MPHDRQISAIFLSAFATSALAWRVIVGPDLLVRGVLGRELVLDVGAQCRQALLHVLLGQLASLPCEAGQVVTLALAHRGHADHLVRQSG
jgi:hypothetical protein